MDWRVIEWIYLGFRVVVVLHHQHDLGGLRVDLEPHDIEAAAFGGLDRAGNVLLAEITRPTMTHRFGRLAHGAPLCELDRADDAGLLNGALVIDHAAAPPDFFFRSNPASSRISLTALCTSLRTASRST